MKFSIENFFFFAVYATGVILYPVEISEKQRFDAYTV